MLQPNEIQLLHTLLKQARTNKPFLEASSKYRQLTGKSYTPEQIAAAFNLPITEQPSLF
jgi:hypothetical protein